MMGWATGRFGLFSLKADAISDGDLNYVGVGLALFALALFIFIEPVSKKEGAEDPLDDAESKFHTLDKQDSTFGGQRDQPLLPVGTPSAPVKTWVSDLSPSSRRLIGIGMSLVMGVFFGCSFTPANIAMQNSYDDDDADEPNKPDPLDYVFSHLAGIFVTSTIYFLIYIAAKGGWSKAQKVPAVRLPAVVSGIMWCIAQVSWFIANGALGFSVSFPMITSGPGLVAAVIGVVVFKEIEGKKNYAILAAAFVCTCVANVLIVMSR